MNPETKNCKNCQKDFIIEQVDFEFYEKVDVPPPTWCPPCRLMRRLAWRNERALYRHKCDLCGTEVHASYAPENPQPMYCQKCWWSDDWDPTSFGRDYDFTRPFFDQFRDLMKVAPVRSVFGIYTTLINSEYTNLVSYLKNCYLIFNSDYNEECMYGTEIEHSKGCVDNTMIDGCEFCSGCVNCKKCYRTFYSTNCESCVDTWFSKNCSGCTNIFACANLKNRQYCIFNEQYSKEEYEKKIAEFKTGSHRSFIENEEAIKKWALQFPERCMQGRQNSNASGEYIYNSRDTRDTYIATEAWNCRYCMWLLVPPIKDCYDLTEYGDNAELCYDTITSGAGSSLIRFSATAGFNSRNVSYSFTIASSSNLFGCMSMRKKEYCILNKQYTKEEYEELLPKIIEHMKSTGEYGEFFPMNLSPFPYNDTNAHEYFPKTKEEVLGKGLNWREPDVRSYKVSMTKDTLPDSITETPDSIVNEIISCEHEGKCQHQCTTAFKVIPKELEFYRTHNLPIPRQCPNCRAYKRAERRRSLSIYDRTCAKCQAAIKTSYSPDRPEIVYCESCYQAEFV